MNLETIMPSRVSQKEKDKYDIIYMWHLKDDTKETIYDTETDSQGHREQICGCQGVESWVRDGLGGWG